MNMQARNFYSLCSQLSWLQQLQSAFHWQCAVLTDRPRASAIWQYSWCQNSTWKSAHTILVKPIGTWKYSSLILLPSMIHSAVTPHFSPIQSPQNMKNTPTSALSWNSSPFLRRKGYSPYSLCARKHWCQMLTKRQQPSTSTLRE